MNTASGTTGSGSTPDGLDLPALTEFFAARVPGFSGTLEAEPISGGKSNLTFLLTDGTHRWVLRRPPLGELTPSAHDMLREYRVVAALSGTDVPVAPAVAYDDTVLDVPFAVVEYVDGPVLRTEQQLHELPDADIERCGYGLVDVLASLHSVDPDSVGLGDLGKPAGYLERQVRRWYDQWQRVRTRDLPDIDTLHAELATRCPPESGASIVHGDYRIDNTILDPADPARVRAVVDWEMATLGDPLADLGLHLVYSDPSFAPVLAGSAASTSAKLPSADAVAGRYAEVSGRDLSRFEFYLGLGYFKIAVVAEGIHARYQQGMTRGEGFDHVSEAVAPLVDGGLRALRGDFA